MEKQKKRLLIFAVFVLLVVIITNSCNLPEIPEINKGIWGKSRYGEAVFAGDKREISGESEIRDEVLRDKD